MACHETKTWCGVFLFLLGAISLLLQNCVNGEPKVPCFFIFGDSLVDNGNNNLLLTSFQADYPPYGVDFPYGATGRFTNGRTVADIIGELIGFDGFIPSFGEAMSTGNLTIGVNYASGSAGIRDESGKQLGDNLSFNKQLIYHQMTVWRLIDMLGSADAAKSYLSKCLYSVGFGINDYIQNYFLPTYPTGLLYTPQQYATLLINQYSSQIKNLHDVGARKIVLNGLLPVGCVPFVISQFGANSSGCVDKVNNAVQLFNHELVSLVDQLNDDVDNATFTYINLYDLYSAAAAGFKFTKTSCCPTRSSNGLCVRDGTPCQNRTEYQFFDANHPSEAANLFVAIRSYNASGPSDAYPYDISQLIAM